MKTNARTGELKGIGGLDYIEFQNVPMKDSEFGEVIDCDYGILEKIAAKAIISERIPIRGREVAFLRKVLGLSRERFAARLDLTSGALVKWEKAMDERLHPVNEAAVRAFVAEQLGVEISGRFSELVGKDQIQHLTLHAG